MDRREAGGAPLRSILPVGTNKPRHNYIGHNYIGHNYIGHNYIGHNYIGHNYIGHNYIGHSTNKPRRRLYDRLRANCTASDAASESSLSGVSQRCPCDGCDLGRYLGSGTNGGAGGLRCINRLPINRVLGKKYNLANMI